MFIWISHKDLTVTKPLNIYFGHTNRQKDVSVGLCGNQLGKYVGLSREKVKAKVNAQVLIWQTSMTVNLRRYFSKDQKEKEKVKGQQEKVKAGGLIPRALMDKSYSAGSVTVPSTSKGNVHRTKVHLHQGKREPQSFTPRNSIGDH